MQKINGIIEKLSLEPEELINHIGEVVVIQGSIYKIRFMSGFAFVILQTPRNLVQCIYNPDHCNEDLYNIKEQSCVRITGTVLSDERSKAGYEVRIDKITLLSTPYAETPVVINNKSVVASMDTLLDYRPITLRNEKERAVFKLQEGICKGIRDYLFSQSFTEIHTPKIVFAGAEGGANIFKLEYFGKEVYLAQSPQFYKQMMVGVYEKVFEIAPVYRAEKHDTSRHLNEYISVDLEIGYINSFYDLMQMETKMLQSTLDYLKEAYSYELDLLKVDIPAINEIPLIEFSEAKQLVSKEYNRPIHDFDDFEPEEERLLYEYIKKQTNCDFVFVTHYPTRKRPFYAMEDEKDPSVTCSFDLLFRGVEVTTGGQRINDYVKQVQKMKDRNMNPELFESYLMLHKFGIPPHGGLGLGLERFTMRLLGQNNVRYSSLFPRDTSRVTP